MLQNIFNVIAVIGTIIAILTWIDVTPQRLGQITKRYVVKKWYFCLAIFFTCITLSLIILKIQAGNQYWWSYLETAITPIILWFLAIYCERSETKCGHVIEMIIDIVIPITFIFSGLGRIFLIFNNAISSNSTLLTLLMVRYYFLFAGFFIGFNLYNMFLRKKLKEVKLLGSEAQEIVTKARDFETKLRGDERFSSLFEDEQYQEKKP